MNYNDAEHYNNGKEFLNEFLGEEGFWILEAKRTKTEMLKIMERLTPIEWFEFMSLNLVANKLVIQNNNLIRIEIINKKENQISAYPIDSVQVLPLTEEDKNKLSELSLPVLFQLSKIILPLNEKAVLYRNSDLDSGKILRMLKESHYLTPQQARFHADPINRFYLLNYIKMEER